MASVSPAAPGDSALDPQPELGVMGGLVAATGLMSTNGTFIANRSDCKLSIFHFTGVSDADVWNASSSRRPPRNLVAVAWQGDDVDVDHASVTITARGPTASIRFDTDVVGATLDGYLWVLHRS